MNDDYILFDFRDRRKNSTCSFFYALTPNGLATMTGGANGEAAGGTRLRGMRHTDSHFCFGRRSRRCSPLRMA
jgi:hypothetical protein